MSATREARVGPRGRGAASRDGPGNWRVRAVRWILGGVIALVLLAVAAVLLATLVINPDRYKGEIESAVRRDTGRPLVLQGHLRLTWLPWLGVRTGAARLGSPRGAVGPNLLAWQSAAVGIRLLPLLLHRRLEVGRIRITGADIQLRRGADGGGSWDDLIARLRSGNRTTTHGAAASRSSAAWPAAWGGLDLLDSSLHYVDQRTHEHVTLTGWRLEVGGWRAGAPLSVSTRFRLHVRTPGPPASPPGASALRMPAAGVRVSLDVPRLQVHAAPLELTAPHWRLDVADAQLQGALHASRDAGGRLTAGGSVTAAVSSVRQLGRTLGIRMPATEDPASLAALSLSAGWSYRDGALRVEPLLARLDATTLTGWIARSEGPSSTWTFALRADQVDVGRYLTRSTRQQPPPELPVSSLRALRARGTIELERARIDGTTLENLRLKVQ